MWTQFLKPNHKVIEPSRAEFDLEKLQEDNFNVRANSPLPINNPTGTKKTPNPRKSNKLHGDNLSSIKKYFKLVHTTKNNTPHYSYKNKKIKTPM